jgi:hypothetical protein
MTYIIDFTNAFSDVLGHEVAQSMAVRTEFGFAKKGGKSVLRELANLVMVDAITLTNVIEIAEFVENW